MKSMDTFDPDMPCHVHDGLNDQIIECSPQWAWMYRQHASRWDEGVIAGTVCYSTDAATFWASSRVRELMLNLRILAALYRHQFA
ncbi:hypothetical protein CO683_38150 [Bradyrhizobium ottawaense]|uniref:Uncharacterized protein n=1 Tax=Bradyrhizobium ottawaense TaxID=931866 RepID=A0A2U8P5R5_9BRAD|nr:MULTISPECIES: hypothetical protein [Bradyrhizobium]AWL93071.1 hypothetical protein CIT37_13320 [Bradyrhizobium ottawaense]MBR1329855.1 hypothetical protein [Bradyrhizobium ottawaense]MBR1335371.1 hypothetical protein [Bradyrhizobium ottawaense]MBR1364917.1 hypothetical protein [Bradyrhizobium ottawaense]PDT64445.1 hypothetical protein CO683_38150 [Bradyrhizobium ottawaense]